MKYKWNMIISNIIDSKLISLIKKNEYSIGDTLGLSDSEKALLLYYKKRLSENYPLDYILGEVKIGSVLISLVENVFIPRPCTEKLIKIANQIIQDSNINNILDVCSGTGFIGLSVAKLNPSASITCIEKSDIAYKVIQKNITINNLKNIKVYNCDALSYVFDDQVNTLLLCNPPYVPDIEFDNSVLFEPKDAIYSGIDGLTFFKKFIRMFTNKFPDQFIFELDPRNIFEAQQYFKNTFYTEVIKDDEGFNRFLIGKRIIL
jgi:release factor glutamine methyltransferase